MKNKLGCNEICPICGKKIKHCTGHINLPKKTVVLNITLIVSLIVVILTITFFHDNKPAQNCKPQAPSANSEQKKLRPSELPTYLGQSSVKLDEYLRSKTITDDVTTFFKPVCIYVNGDPIGSGSLFTTINGLTVVTAAHIFSSNNHGNFTFKLLRPFKDRHRNIIKVEYYGDPKHDTVFCYEGAEPTFIEGFDTKQRIFVSESRIRIFQIGTKETWFTSLLSGQRYMMIGVNRDTGMGILSCDHAIAAGESGSGFISDDGRKLFVLSKCYELDLRQWPDQEKIDPIFTKRTLFVLEGSIASFGMTSL